MSSNKKNITRLINLAIGFNIIFFILLINFCLTNDVLSATTSNKVVSSSTMMTTTSIDKVSVSTKEEKSTVKQKTAKEKLPGSFVMFLNNIKERIVLFFTFDPVKKAQKNVDYALKKIALAKTYLVEKNIKTDDNIKALKLLKQADKLIKKVQQSEKKWINKQANSKKQIKDKIEQYNLERKFLKATGMDKISTIEVKKDNFDKENQADNTTSTSKSSTTTVKLIKQIQKVEIKDTKRQILVDEQKKTAKKVDKGTKNTVNSTENKAQEQASVSNTSTTSSSESPQSQDNYEQFASTYINYYDSLDQALEGFFFKKMYRYFKYEPVVYDKKIGDNKKIWWLEVTNKLGKPIELAFVLTDYKDGQVMIYDIIPRDYLLSNFDKKNKFFTKYIDGQVLNSKVNQLHNGQKTGSHYMATELRIMAVDAINSMDHGSADFLLTAALAVVGDNNIEYKAKIYSNFGLLYNNLHKSKASITAMYEKAVSLLDKSYYNYHAFKGIIANTNNDEAEAIKHFTNALKISTTSFESLQYLGRIYLDTKDPNLRDCNKAQEYFDKANQSGFGTMGFELGRSYICLGNFVSAVELFEAELVSSSINSMSKIYHYLSLAYIGNKQFEKAVSSYIASVEINQNLRTSVIEDIICKNLKEKSKCGLFASLD